MGVVGPGVKGGEVITEFNHTIGEKVETYFLAPNRLLRTYDTPTSI